MKNPELALKYAIFVTAQVLIWNFCDFSQYMMLCFLPALIMYLPINHGYIYSMVFAFAIGFAVDFLSSGMLGLTAAALLPVAFMRVAIINMVFGSELFSREENLSLRKQGAPKMLTCIVLSTALFLAVYIWADGAGTRPFLFNLLKFFLSLGLSSLVSYFVIRILESENR